VLTYSLREEKSSGQISPLVREGQLGFAPAPQGHAKISYMGTLSSLFNSMFSEITQPLIQPLSVSIGTASRMVGVSSRTIRRLIASGALQSTKVGSRRVVSVQSLERLVN
jgi:excisionase family DNA binding protein